MIGHDPAADRYPPEWLVFLPERLRGRYDAPGWTANGVAPWGLQPDPIGADGNLFFRGFFNLLLSAYEYVSGDSKWQRPFEMTGYRDRRFRWTHHEIAEFIHMYGSHERFKGRVSGFTMGTGSTLALLPAENATGNFVKVVQRLPVRIELQDYDPDETPLFIGLSVTPYVDVHEKPTGPDAGKLLQPYLAAASEAPPKSAP